MYAYENIHAALRFAERLAAISLKYAAGHTSHLDERRDDLHRISSVLELLIEQTPIIRASLWKLKSRAGYASVIAAPWLKSDDPSSNVIPIADSLFGTLLCRYDQKKLSKPNSVGIIHIEKLQDIASDPYYFTAEHKQTMGTMRLLAYPFSFQRSPAWVPRRYPNLIMNMLLPAYDSDVKFQIPREILAAVASKILSGISALIDRRMVRITEAMTSISVARVNEGGDYAVREAIIKVLPRYIYCERVLGILSTPSGTFRRVIDHSFTSEPAASVSNLFPSTAVETLGQIASRFFERKENRLHKDSKRADSYLPDDKELSELNEELSRFGVSPSHSVLFGRVHNRVEPQNPRGYVVLFNRSNDFAAMKVPPQSCPDFFDWEDELYLNHICAVLDMILELFTAEESRLTTAHILAHEIHAPNGFIYATAERLWEASKGRREMPSTMQAKELDDIMNSAELQSTFVDSMMITMQTTALPPSSRYLPSYVDLNETAQKVARTIIPLCRRFKLDPQRITFGHMPKLFIDRRAFTQILINLCSNAIKYAIPFEADRFNVKIICEHVQSEELTTTQASLGILERLKRNSASNGYLFSFEDDGIGFSAPFAPKAFISGTRDIANEVVAGRQGAGLGLGLVRQIVRDHFGDVWIESIGRPTVVQFFLPSLLDNAGYQRLWAWRNSNRDTGA